MNCEELRASVVRWFGNEIQCRASGPDALIATLPILKPDGDPIEIGIEPTGGQWRLSDLGETYSTLYLAGVELYEEYVRAEEFRQIVAAHKLADEDNELSTVAKQDELIDRMFDFVQAIQSMLALQMTVKPKLEKRDFPSLVAKFFAEQRTSFDVPSENIQGKTGRWKFNFVLNHVGKETLVKALTATSAGAALRSAEQNVFEIRDVQEVREVAAVVITDDEGYREHHWKPHVLAIFRGYEIPIYPFQRGRQGLLKLAADYAR